MFLSIEHVMTVLAVAEDGGITNAARRIGIRRNAQVGAVTHRPADAAIRVYRAGCQKPRTAVQASTRPSRAAAQRVEA